MTRQVDDAAMTSTRILLLSIASIALMALVAGCGTAQHPDAALRDYVENVRDRRPDAIYDTLGEELRGGMSREDFRAFFDENYDEILSQAEAIERALDNDQLAIAAALPIGEHAEIALEYGEDRWQLVDDVPVLAGAASPRGTLVALSQAVETKDLGALLLLLSREKSDTLSAELDILRAGLANVGDDDIIVHGDTATVYLDWGLRLELVFEDGAWRMHRLDQAQ